MAFRTPVIRAGRSESPQSALVRNVDGTAIAPLAIPITVTFGGDFNRSAQHFNLFGKMECAE